MDRWTTAVLLVILMIVGIIGCCQVDRGLKELEQREYEYMLDQAELESSDELRELEHQMELLEQSDGSDADLERLHGHDMYGN